MILFIFKLSSQPQSWIFYLYLSNIGFYLLPEIYLFWDFIIGITHNMLNNDYNIFTWVVKKKKKKENINDIKCVSFHYYSYLTL